MTGKTDAERMRDYRGRIRRGAQIISVEITQNVVEGLLAKRLLHRDDIGDNEAIANALLRGVLEMNK